MAAHSLTASPAALARCPVHHLPVADCPPPDGDLTEVLADLHGAGIPVHVVTPQLLDMCDSFLDCTTEQAEVLICTTGRERGDATFTSWHQACSGCLWFAVSADLRSGYAVTILVPSHTGVAA